MKYKTFLVQTEKEDSKVNKEVNTNIITISYKIELMIVRNLWQIHYQILLIILQKKLKRLNVKNAIVWFFLIQKCQRKSNKI